MPPTDPDDRRRAQIVRINELSGLARTAWFSLLGYLVFVGITLLGVRDADFFVPTRQTDLPLVGVQIPTGSFFLIAPVLGAALYIYLHLFLIKLWDAHAEACTTEADATHHWLVNDFVLLCQNDLTTRARSLSWLIVPVTLFLVWAAGPIVLGFAWWRSMPAHNEWMTLLIGACFWITLVVGAASWCRADFLIGPRRLHWSTGAGVPVAGLTAFALVALSWLRTEGGFDRYAAWGWTLDAVSFTIPAGLPINRHWRKRDQELPLAKANVIGFDLVALPAGWRDPELAVREYQINWCKRSNISDADCASIATQKGGNYFSERGPFAALDLGGEPTHKLFLEDWGRERAAYRKELPKVNLAGRDLRYLFAVLSSFVGAHMKGARLGKADLRSARLEGAMLQEADLTGIAARGARFDWADLRDSRVTGANLIDAVFIDADLSGAQLCGSSLRGATFLRSDMRDADLSNSDLTGTDMSGALSLTQEQLDGAVGDETTLLPYSTDWRNTALFVWSCWESEPPNFDEIASFGEATNPDAVRRKMLCGPDNPRVRTGTPTHSAPSLLYDRERVVEPRTGGPDLAHSVRACLTGP